jgi:hypothetical protein
VGLSSGYRGKRRELLRATGEQIAEKYLGQVLIGLLVKGVGALGNAASAGLTASSTCQQFLNVDEQTEQQALVDIAESKGIGGFGSPLALNQRILAHAAARLPISSRSARSGSDRSIPLPFCLLRHLA